MFDVFQQLFIVCKKQVIKALFQLRIDILDELEAVLVPVDKTERVLLWHDSHQLLVLSSGQVNTLAPSLTILIIPSHIEEHPTHQHGMMKLSGEKVVT